MKENLFSVRGMVGKLPVISMPMLSDERWEELTKAPAPSQGKEASEETTMPSVSRQKGR